MHSSPPRRRAGQARARQRAQQDANKARSTEPRSGERRRGAAGGRPGLQLCVAQLPRAAAPPPCCATGAPRCFESEGGPAALGGGGQNWTKCSPGPCSAKGGALLAPPSRAGLLCRPGPATGRFPAALAAAGRGMSAPSRGARAFVLARWLSVHGITGRANNGGLSLREMAPKAPGLQGRGPVLLGPGSAPGWAQPAAAGEARVGASGRPSGEGEGARARPAAAGRREGCDRVERAGRSLGGCGAGAWLPSRCSAMGREPIAQQRAPYRGFRRMCSSQRNHMGAGPPSLFL